MHRLTDKCGMPLITPEYALEGGEKKKEKEKNIWRYNGWQFPEFEDKP